MRMRRLGRTGYEVSEIGFGAWPIGGTWGGAQGIDDTIFPLTYSIDYVRYYERD